MWPVKLGNLSGNVQNKNMFAYNLNVALNRRFTATIDAATWYFLAACAVISNYLQFLFNKALQYKTISKGHCLFDALSLFIQLIASSARLKQTCRVFSMARSKL